MIWRKFLVQGLRRKIMQKVWRNWKLLKMDGNKIEAFFVFIALLFFYDYFSVSIRATLASKTS
jgi:hypothetical protein